MRTRAIVLGMLVACGVGCSQEVPVGDPLRQILAVSERRGQLEMEGGTPFHLVASFEQLDGSGRPAGKGSIDEVWVNPRRYKQVLTLPAFEEVQMPGGRVEDRQLLSAAPRQLVEVDNGTRVWRTGRWVLFSDFLTPLLQPFALLAAESRLGVERPGAGVENLDCVGTQPQLPGVGQETQLALTTYCLAKGNHLLKVVRRPNRVEMTYNDAQPFGKKYVARSIDVVRGTARLKIHIDVLEEAQDAAELDAAVPEGAQVLGFHRADLPRRTGELMLGQLLSKVSPQYPQEGLRGTITVKCHVNTKGEVESEEVLGAANQQLKAPVVNALKAWRFRVSYRGDKLVDVDRVIRFSYGGEEVIE